MHSLLNVLHLANIDMRGDGDFVEIFLRELPGLGLKLCAVPKSREELFPPDGSDECVRAVLGAIQALCCERDGGKQRHRRGSSGLKMPKLGLARPQKSPLEQEETRSSRSRSVSVKTRRASSLKTLVPGAVRHISDADAQLDTESEKARRWLYAYIGRPDDGRPLPDAVADGVPLCLAMNKLFPGSIQPVHTKPLPDQAAENLAAYRRQCAAIGLPPDAVPDLSAKRSPENTVRLLAHIQDIANYAAHKTGCAGLTLSLNAAPPPLQDASPFVSLFFFCTNALISTHNNRTDIAQPVAAAPLTKAEREIIRWANTKLEKKNRFTEDGSAFRENTSISKVISLAEVCTPFTGHSIFAYCYPFFLFLGIDRRKCWILLSGAGDKVAQIP